MLIFCAGASEHEKGVIAFDQLTFKGSRQNWSVSAAENGFVFFANHTGLLMFDGTSWKLNRLPVETILRAVNAASDSLIYTGGYMELGYWKKNSTGELDYFSLTPKASKYFSKNIEFWNIARTDDNVYFQSFSQILAYQGDSVFQVDLHGQISVMNNVHNKVLVAVSGRGIFEISGLNAVPVIQDKLLENEYVRFIIPFYEDQILIGTISHGILLWDGKRLTPWNKAWNDYFVENELNRGYLTSDNHVIVGTLVDGIVVFDTDGNMISKINTSSGLPNNTVLGIEPDRLNNIWLALDDGIGFVSGNQDRSFEIEKLPGLGAIYSTAIYKNKLYLGTNQGLFVKSEKPGEHELNMVPKLSEQIWDLKVFDDQLLIGHNLGTFSLKDGSVRQISTESGGFNFIEDPANPNLILQSTYNSLIVFEKTTNGIVFRNRIGGFIDLIRYIEFDHRGNLWASHMHRGIYKIAVDSKRDSVREAIYYGKEIFGKDYFVHVFKVENRIVFTTGEKFFTYDDLNDSIIPYNTLNEGVGKYSKSHRIVSAPNHHYWFIGKEYIGLFSILNDNIELIKEYPMSLFHDPVPIENYENILPLSSNNAILSLQNGIAYLDATQKGASPDLIQRQTPGLRRIEVRNKKGKVKLLPLGASEGTKLSHNFNNISFNFSFPLINELPVYYQYVLEGIDDEWSEETSRPVFSFVRLPKGDYVLKVKAVDSWGNESQIYKFSFEVLPPFYASFGAKLFYFLVLISSLLIFRNWGVRQTRRKIQLQQEKKEKELIRLRNEKLQAEIRFKSKELASSTMSIIKKNEFLLDLKTIIQKQKAELGSRYPDKYYNYLSKKIDDNISSHDDWKIFETNFERAHEQFFEKLKNKYPLLTPSDMQLCAFLRMNLSSKEIAPMLGISVRGVENHRYRLRKKLELDVNDSLTDAIIGL
ncbi:Y_Y_Y domain-containing protein [Mariniphaga anaerophila]|uniref:Y_Y_Y domain-containing protein n=1 Tax=Mariniphaga anaerophila TaxID=1484053 RepID=A0A1M5E927_9BACT|nr:triple tyrosine motif-containing protein [Mariniphaga anaerophila]SHF75717.1 Y_Y_Y domain-containing protein [Mariniphaga anaerophila]